MGWLDVYRGRGLTATQDVARVWPQVEAWTTGQLTQIVWADILGLDTLPPSRAEGMMVPAVARARHLIATSVARCPLQAWRGPDLLPDLDQPVWMYGTDTDQSPYQRMLWTADDLLFYGVSLWEVTGRAVAGDRTLPSRLSRVPWDEWEVSHSGEIVDLDGIPYTADQAVLIPGPHEGILSFGARSLRMAAMLDRAALDIAQSPFRLELHQTTADILDPVEIKDMIATTRAALADNHGVLYTNPAIETKAHGGAAEQLVVEGRNASAVDMARHCNIPAAMIDANTAGASLTYETQAGRNQQFLDYSVQSYLDPIAARLSMDDILPRGQRATFDTTPLTALAVPAGGPPVQD